ncbi:MAG: dehydrogenase E1 component subunit alpha/beta [Acidobacteria bacterium]|nr:dehydrogenase E1 component subunit alpha/beta [Acidobacteriota bacterium]
MIHKTDTQVRKAPPFSTDLLVQAYRTMLLSRRLDEKELQLKRQGRSFFQISGAGNEAVSVAAALHLRPSYDWFFPYYRDRALCLQLGITPVEMLKAAVGAADGLSSGARQMPNHWTSSKLNIVSPSSATGTQILHAVGAAETTRTLSHVPEAANLLDYKKGDDISYVSLGDGATSEGEFWEALNAACLGKLALLFVVQDNGWAISVPVEHQTSGGSISQAIQAFPGLTLQEFDGTDFLESYRATGEAVEHLRAGRGPVLLHAHTTRPFSHSNSDDERHYKPEHIRKEEAERDALAKWKAHLLREQIATEKEIQTIEASVHQEIQSATDEALAAEPPQPEKVRLHVYSPRVDPTASAFDRPARFSGEPKTMVDLINACLQDEMDRDPRVVVFGEDVADSSHEQYLSQVKGKGGVFKVTGGLQRRFGSARCYNTPIAEAGIVGRAIGQAVRGLKPVVEIQFFDYIWPAYMQIRNELALMRWRSNNNFSSPLVIRVPIGGYLSGGSIYHSQSGESLFTHLPGLRVILPSTALDANGLLRTAIRSDDPVLFLEPKHLYRQTYNRSPYPGPDYMIPFGKGNLVRTGENLTLITFGSLVHRSEQAAKALREEGISVEIIDLRSLNPYDWEMISDSVRKTNRALIVYEDDRSWGYGAEIAARVADELFDSLDAPVRRLARPDCAVPYHPELERAVLPQVEDIIKSCRELASY